MKINAISVANYFVDLSLQDNVPIHLIGLVKRVYIAHGFSLAIFHKGLLDPRFDKVEAWKYGPVIPSVYHSFKQFQNNPITDKAVIMEWQDEQPVFVTPQLDDDDAKRVCTAIWKRYIKHTDSRLVYLTHLDGTPWSIYYKEGANINIPDPATQHYYEVLTKNITNGKQ